MIDPHPNRSGRHVIDAHGDALSRALRDDADLHGAGTRAQFDLQRAAAGGLTAQVLASFVWLDDPLAPAAQTLRALEALHRLADSSRGRAILGRSVSDLDRARDEGAVALIFAMEGAEGLEGDLDVFRSFVRQGLRMIGLTWDRRNEAADGLNEAGTGGGLTSFGERLVYEAARSGVVVDMAHLAPAGVDQLMDRDDVAIAVSHACCRELCDHPRNLSDAALERLAARGGVLGITAVPPLLGGNGREASRASLIRHVLHAVSVMGSDHVGLGLDFDGVGPLRVDGLRDPSDVPALADDLTAAGLSSESVAKIMGDNWRALFARTWRN